jgi:hypothetical protein
MLSGVIGAVIYCFFPLKLSRFNLCRRILPSVRIYGGFYSIRSNDLSSLASLASLASPLHFIPFRSSFREISLHCYSDSKSMLLGFQINVTRIPNHCYSDSKSLLLGFQINVMRYYFSFWIIHPPSIFTVGPNLRRILSTFLFSTFHFVHKHPRPFSLSATSSPLRRSILTALMRPSFFLL